MPYTAAQLTAYYTAVNFGQAPDATVTTTLNQFGQLSGQGSLADAQALVPALNSGQARATTDVAVSVYQYFSGASPSQAGMNFLLNTPGSGLNTSYYNGATGTATNPSAGGFNLENRYYNLAVSQAFQGTNAAAFAATYQPLTLQQTVATAYEQIVGAATVGTAQATAAIAAIQGSIPFFQQVASERAKEFNQDLAAKAIIIGYILEESIKAGVGAYAQALDQFHAAVAQGNAIFNTNILTTYGPGGQGYGIGLNSGVLAINLPGTAIAQQRVNLPQGAFVNAAGTLSGGLTLQLRDASGGSDVMTLVVSNGNNTGAANVSGATVNGLALGGTVNAGLVETLNINSAGSLTAGTAGSDNRVFLDGATAPNTVIIRGAQPLTLNTGAVTHNMTIDGSAATASLTLAAGPTTAANVAINITGGSAPDTLIAGLSSTATAQTLTGNGGGDLFLLSGGSFNYDTYTVQGGPGTHKPVDTLVYKAASDSLIDRDGDPGSSRSGINGNAGKMDVVAGFITGQDKIDIKALGFTQAQITLVDKGNFTDIAALNTLLSSGNLFKDGGATRSVAEIHFEGGSVIFVDANKNGTFEEASDLAVQFVGTANIAVGDFIGT